LCGKGIANMSVAFMSRTIAIASMLRELRRGWLVDMYLGMNYLGIVHISTRPLDLNAMNVFILKSQSLHHRTCFDLKTALGHKPRP
jgi:hypothetical protein